MNQHEFYLNQPKNHECVKLPGQDANYLLKGNYLSEFFSEDEKAEARFNLGITPLLKRLQALISAKLVDQAGNLKFGLEPTSGEENEEAYGEVLSSAVIYETLLKYYTKDQINGWIQNLEERLQILKDDLTITIDGELNNESINPVQNRVITNALEEINTSYNRLSNTKADKEELLNYNTIDEIAELLQQLRDTLTQYSDSKVAEVQAKVDAINEFLETTTIFDELDQSIVEYSKETRRRVDAFQSMQSQDIQGIINENLLFYGENQ